MAEALWNQSAEYSAEEDRKVIGALSTEGVVNGFVVTGTGGTGISISTGTAIVTDGEGGAYVAYTTGAATTISLPNSATTHIYVVVDQDTGITTVTSGSTPSDPYLDLITVVTGVGTSTIPNGGISLKQALPANVAGQYLKLAGGTLTGDLQVPTMGVTGALSAGGGVRLGAAAQPTRRHYAHYVRTSDSASTCPTDGTWHRVALTGAANSGTSDYGVTPHTSTGLFNAPVSGLYAFSGFVTWQTTLTADLDSERHGAVGVIPGSASAAWSNVSTYMITSMAFTGSRVPYRSFFHCTIYIPAGYYACPFVYSNAPGGTQALSDATMTFALLQAF